jgi:hypothetical protein
MSEEKRLSEISKEILQQHFSYPIYEASALLGVSVNDLKKICRSHGIKRWMYSGKRKNSYNGADSNKFSSFSSKTDTSQTTQEKYENFKSASFSNLSVTQKRPTTPVNSPINVLRRGSLQENGSTVENMKRLKISGNRNSQTEFNNFVGTAGLPPQKKRSSVLSDEILLQMPVQKKNKSYSLLGSSMSQFSSSEGKKSSGSSGEEISFQQYPTNSGITMQTPGGQSADRLYLQSQLSNYQMVPMEEPLQNTNQSKNNSSSGFYNNSHHGSMPEVIKSKSNSFVDIQKRDTKFVEFSFDEIPEIEEDPSLSDFLGDDGLVEAFDYNSLFNFTM